ncbi:MAG: hypothetical protein K2K21_12920 [Lachnospiraceae bacterium]|nr:hypothetical protein [Lachnospiraceae bacterium]
MKSKRISSILLIALSVMITACGNTAGSNSNADIDNSETAVTDENSIAGGTSIADETVAANETDSSPESSESEETSQINVVDTDGFVQLPLREINIDLTNDDVPDNICMYLIGDSQDTLQTAEYLVEQQVRMIQVQVSDGMTKDLLYDRTFSIAHVGEGELAIVTDGEKHYLFESNCYEQMGYASYYGEVFDWKDGEKESIDEFQANFLISLDAVYRSVEQGESITLREDAIPDFKEAVQIWNQDSELLVACDTINSLNNVQCVYVNLEENQYTLEDFFSSIWDRTAEKFTVGEFDSIMGYSGFYIYDETYFFTYGYFYAIEDGQSFCIAENWGCSENDSYIVDINGDGENELICNVMWGDGAQNTIIYHRDGSNILCGYADELLDHEYDNIGISSVYTQYLPDENVVEIFYWKEDLQDYKSDKYEIDLEKIEFYPFVPQQ